MKQLIQNKAAKSDTRFVPLWGRSVGRGRRTVAYKKLLADAKTPIDNDYPTHLAEDSVINWKAIVKQFKCIIDLYLENILA